MRVCSYEDSGVAELEPLALTRPAFDLLCGQTSLADKHHRYFGTRARGALVRPHLAPLTRLNDTSVAVNDLSWLSAGKVILVNARWLPPAPVAAVVREVVQSPCVGMVGDEVAYAVLEPAHLDDDSPEAIDEAVRGWKAALPHRPAGGRLVRHLWDLVQYNGEQILLDWELTGRDRPPEPAVAPSVVGPRSGLVIDPTARIDPMVVADTTGGPVVIARDAVVLAFSRLEGPCYIGPRSQVHGAKIRAGTTLGPECRIGGEVEATIVQGYSNKYHEGFLGHAYLGEWVNLGAGTQASDVRNDYGEVRVTVNGRVIGSGQTKVGCFIGDHTRTGLGVLLNTGTNAGVFGNLLPSGELLPKYIPSFCSWWNGALRENADVEALLAAAGVVMQRRGKVFHDAHRELFRALFEGTAAERRRALREHERRRWRRAS